MTPQQAQQHPNETLQQGGGSAHTGDPTGNLQTLGAADSAPRCKAMMAVNDMETPPTVCECGNEPWEILQLMDDAKRVYVSVLAVPHRTSSSRCLWHRVHHHLHNVSAGFPRESIRNLVVAFMGPFEDCPFCGRSTEEEAGPILIMDRLLNGEERPAVAGNEGSKPGVEDLGGHEGEHGTGAGGLVHEAMVKDGGRCVKSVTTSIAVPILRDAEGEYAIHPRTGLRITRPAEKDRHTLTTRPITPEETLPNYAPLVTTGKEPLWVVKFAQSIFDRDFTPGLDVVLRLKGPDGVVNDLRVSLRVTGEAHAPGIVEGCGMHYLASVSWGEVKIVNGVLIAFRRKEFLAKLFVSIAAHLTELGEVLAMAGADAEPSPETSRNDARPQTTGKKPA